MRESIIDADRTKREKAKKLRYKKTIVKELNLMTIQMELSDIQEACEDVHWYFDSDDDTLLNALDGNQDEEYECILDKIRIWRERGGSYGDIAVLFRTNTQPRKLVEELISEGIPFRMRDSLPNLYDHWIVKDVFTYLHMAKGSLKRSDFLQIMNRPKRYLGRECLESEEISWEALLTWYDDKPWV